MTSEGAPAIRSARVLGRSGFPSPCVTCGDNTRATTTCPLCQGSVFCPPCFRRHAATHGEERYVLPVAEGLVVQEMMEEADPNKLVDLVMLEGGESCRLERDKTVWDRVYKQMVVPRGGPRIRQAKPAAKR